VEIYFFTLIKPFALETVLTDRARISQLRAAESGRASEQFASRIFIIQTSSAASLVSGRSRPTPFKNASAAFMEKTSSSAGRSTAPTELRATT
jgi:hypothetical protein